LTAVRWQLLAIVYLWVVGCSGIRTRGWPGTILTLLYYDVRFDMSSLFPDDLDVVVHVSTTHPGIALRETRISLTSAFGSGRFGRARGSWRIGFLLL
jgi:hypothetical protein